ncbi:MAG: asparaginase [Variibacter sp.]
MSNPVLIEAWRGERVESRHRGSIAVVDADGATVLALGDVEQAVYPRSAIKALQALPLIESGAADRFKLDDEQLALACASHNGEPVHAATAARTLAAAGRDATTLECGAHWPSNDAAARALAATGAAPSALHNNCSGKHAGFVCAACAMGVDHHGYVDPRHPLQREIKAGIERIAGVKLDAPAIDGCSAPNWPAPLPALAFAFARFGAGQGLSPETAKAAARLRAACAAKPWFVAGSGRFCTKVMEHFGARVFVKTGAEGVFCGALPELGLGIAVKADDGAKRAAETMMAAMIARFVSLMDADRTFLDPLLAPVMTNWNGLEVGKLQATDALIGAR